MSEANKAKLLEEVVLQLHEIGAVKFGSFKLKSGIVSPIYFDLRVMVSFPHVLNQVVSLIWSSVEKKSDDFVCGVPYTALPIASLLSVQQNFPMVVCRKERKEHGTGKDIEGIFHAGQSTLVIEDVVTSGLSVLETVGKLNNAGLVVKNVVAFLDREQGAKANLAAKGLHVISVIKVSDFLQVLRKHNKITDELVGQIKSFLSQNQSALPSATTPPASPAVEKRQRYGDRAEKTKLAISQKVLRLMEAKKSNLCVAADVKTSQELLQLVKQIGSHIVMLKTHVDVIDDFTPQLAAELKKLAAEHQFVIFEDRKFADIGNTAKAQYTGGIYKIASWADISNSHLVSGTSSIGALQEGAKAATSEPRGLLLIAQMSTQDTPTANAQLLDLSLQTAQHYGEFVCGFICQGKLKSKTGADESGWLFCTPGVHVSAEGDSHGQTYKTPEAGSDVIIVGRGITAAPDPKAAAQTYQQRGWKAYEASL